MSAKPKPSSTPTPITNTIIKSAQSPQQQATASQQAPPSLQPATSPSTTTMTQQPHQAQQHSPSIPVSISPTVQPAVAEKKPIVAVVAKEPVPEVSLTEELENAMKPIGAKAKGIFDDSDDDEADFSSEAQKKKTKGGGLEPEQQNYGSIFNGSASPQQAGSRSHGNSYESTQDFFTNVVSISNRTTELHAREEESDEGDEKVAVPMISTFSPVVESNASTLSPVSDNAIPVESEAKVETIDASSVKGTSDANNDTDEYYSLSASTSCSEEVSGPTTPLNRETVQASEGAVPMETEVTANRTESPTIETDKPDNDSNSVPIDNANNSVTNGTLEIPRSEVGVGGDENKNSDDSLEFIPVSSSAVSIQNMFMGTAAGSSGKGGEKGRKFDDIFSGNVVIGSSLQAAKNPSGGSSKAFQLDDDDDDEFFNAMRAKPSTNTPPSFSSSPPVSLKTSSSAIANFPGRSTPPQQQTQQPTATNASSKKSVFDDDEVDDDFFSAPVKSALKTSNPLSNVQHTANAVVAIPKSATTATDDSDDNAFFDRMNAPTLPTPIKVETADSELLFEEKATLAVVTPSPVVQQPTQQPLPSSQPALKNSGTNFDEDDMVRFVELVLLLFYVLYVLCQ
jgi:hypothetical protein